MKTRSAPDEAEETDVDGAGVGRLFLRPCICRKCVYLLRSVGPRLFFVYAYFRPPRLQLLRYACGNRYAHSPQCIHNTWTPRIDHCPL